MSLPAQTDEGYLPALRFRSLTRIYDPLIRATTQERRFRERVLARAELAPDQRVLDLGCGTGTLAVLVKRAEPAAEVLGVDPDREILIRAREKADEASASVRFEVGSGSELPYADDSFDTVLSTLVLHHLTPEERRAALTEVNRILKPGGRFVVAEWGVAPDPLMWMLSWPVRFFDGIERTADSFKGLLPERFDAAGLTEAAVHERFRTPFGAIRIYTARAQA